MTSIMRPSQPGLLVTQDKIDFPRGIDTHEYHWLQRLNFQE